jgi:hypothetical protein
MIGEIGGIRDTDESESEDDEIFAHRKSEKKI